MHATLAYYAGQHDTDIYATQYSIFSFLQGFTIRKCDKKCYKTGKMKFTTDAKMGILDAKIEVAEN